MSSETVDLAPYPLEGIVEGFPRKPVEVPPSGLTRDLHLDLAEMAPEEYQTGLLRESTNWEAVTFTLSPDNVRAASSPQFP